MSDGRHRKPDSRRTIPAGPRPPAQYPTNLPTHTTRTKCDVLPAETSSPARRDGAGSNFPVEQVAAGSTSTAIRFRMGCSNCIKSGILVHTIKSGAGVGGYVRLSWVDLSLIHCVRFAGAKNGRGGATIALENKNIVAVNHRVSPVGRGWPFNQHIAIGRVDDAAAMLRFVLGPVAGGGVQLGRGGTAKALQLHRW